MEEFPNTSKSRSTSSWILRFWNFLRTARSSAGQSDVFSMHFLCSETFSRLSSLNCARIYNISIASQYSHILNNRPAYMSIYQQIDCMPIHWDVSFELRDEFVLNGFFLYSLLLEKAEQRTPLHLSHHETSQRDRLKGALEVRNKAMEGIGQEAYTHACDLCFVVIKDEAGKECESQFSFGILYH